MGGIDDTLLTALQSRQQPMMMPPVDPSLQGRERELGPVSPEEMDSLYQAQQGAGEQRRAQALNESPLGYGSVQMGLQGQDTPFGLHMQPQVPYLFPQVPIQGGNRGNGPLVGDWEPLSIEERLNAIDPKAGWHRDPRTPYEFYRQRSNPMIQVTRPGVMDFRDFVPPFSPIQPEQDEPQMQRRIII